MSLNMHLSVGGREIDLWQTPTYITHMCMTDDTGTVNLTMGGKRAKAAIVRYLEWVKSHLDGAFATKQDLEDRRALVLEHVRLIEFVITNDKPIVVYAS